MHLRVISRGVDGKSNLQINCKCFAFIALLPLHQPFAHTHCSAATAVSGGNPFMFMYISSSNDHNMHRLFIRYTLGLHEDRNFALDVVRQILCWHACLWRTKPLVLPPTFVQENRSVGSCTAPSEITTAWCYKHGLRAQLVRDYKSACSL